MLLQVRTGQTVAHPVDFEGSSNATPPPTRSKAGILIFGRRDSQTGPQKAESPLIPIGKQGAANSRDQIDLPDQDSKTIEKQPENRTLPKIGADSGAVGTSPIDIHRIIELWENLTPADQQAVVDYAEQLARVASILPENQKNAFPIPSNRSNQPTETFNGE